MVVPDFKLRQDHIFKYKQLSSFDTASSGCCGCGRVQVVLGISTLLAYVPVSLGAAHQANALALFTVVLGLLHSLRHPLGAASPFAKAFTPLAAAATVGVWAVVLRADEAAIGQPLPVTAH